ncbi:MAG: 4-(cytidine 5'-diphospho)-2-C-methyl-D-erythritol kinase [Bacteroidota bacterium]
MIRFPNAKINLGLHVISKRPDGFHELETVFYPVKWCDALEIVEAKNSDDVFTLEIQGADFGHVRENICYKAYELIVTDHTLPALNCYLQKVIPHGAGLGGGSADAAFTLKMIDELFTLKITNDDLLKYASQLGSDCSFFIYNKPMMASGRGEILQPCNVDIEKYFLVIVMPDVKVNTNEAYQLIAPATPDIPLSAIIQLPVNEWKYALVNDFEKPVFEKYPAIKEIKTQLYKSGAVYASMSGSGSAVFGLFEKPVDVKNTFSDCIVWSGN